jgi:hypothetical protein
MGEVEFKSEEPLLPKPNPPTLLVRGRPRAAASGGRRNFDRLASQSQAALKNSARPARRSSRRPVLADFRVRCSFGGELRDFELLDISNRGLGLHLPAGVDLDLVMPGRRLSSIAIMSHGDEVLHGVGAVVRRTGLSRTPGTAGYEIGLEFEAERPTRRSPGYTAELDAPAQVEKLIVEALRNGLVLRPLDGIGQSHLFWEGAVDPVACRLRLRGSAADLRAGDAVRVTGEATGFSCAFYSGVIETNSTERWPLVLSLPRVVQAGHPRSTYRVRPPDEKQVKVEFQSPFDVRRVRATALDVSSAGVSFAVGALECVLPVGTILDPIALSFPDGRVAKVRGRVQSLARSGGDGSRRETGELRCGVEFESIPEQARPDLADGVLRLARPQLVDANEIEFKSLWSFLSETGFLYPEKMEELAPAMPQIEHTFKQLLGNRKSELLKTILFRRDGEVLGHISAVRAYRRTWLLQHVAALPKVEALFAAQAVTLGLAEYLEQIPQIDWARVFFRPNNRWPARIFGTFARQLTEPTLSELRLYSYHSGPTAVGQMPAASGIEILPARREHLDEVQRFFLAQGRIVALQAEDLSLDGLFLEEVDRHYAAAGLERSREVLVAQSGNTFAGFALLEISSPGLNLSELTNHFSVHVVEGGSATRQALIAAAQRRYRELGRLACVGLSEGDGSADFEAMGLRKRKEYLGWTLHRSLWGAFSNYVERLFNQTRNEPQNPIARTVRTVVDLEAA